MLIGAMSETYPRSMERCSWCGASVEPDDGFRLYEPAGERRAAFCRLEHVVPWAIQGAHWEPGDMDGPAAIEAREALKPHQPHPSQSGLRPSVPGQISSCAHCGDRLGDVHVLLVRHRGEHRVADDFCGVDHLLEWAKAGGRWR
jgi:hypothetical protein